MDSKNSLREKFFFQRSLISAKKVERCSDAILKLLLQFEPLLNANLIFTYLSFNNEVNTLKLARLLLDKNKQLVIPCVSKGVIIPAEIKTLAEDLCRGRFGILEPRQDSLRPVSVQAIEIFIVPGIVFDQQGYRLGFGYGYFDRLLTQASAAALKLGLAYDFQIIPQLPTAPWDIKMDFVFTEQRVINCQEPL